MAEAKSKDLAKKIQLDKVLREKAFKIANGPTYGYQRGLASMVSKIFNKNPSGTGDNKPNYQLEDELHKPIIKKFKNRKVYSSFRDNIWGADLAMQVTSKCNKGIKYLLCAIDIFSKYAPVVPLKDKRGISIVNAFPKIISEERKPNKIWVDEGSKFYNTSFKGFLKINNIEMYSTHNEEKSVVAERFIRTLKNKIFNYMTAFSKNIYFDALDNIVNEYNITVHRTIKMKPILMLNTIKILMKKMLNLKLVIVLEFQNTKTFLLKDTLQIGEKKFLFLVKVKMQFRGLMQLLT